MLKSLHTRNVGPARAFDAEFGERLNLLTGDNGLGKTFLLELAWWALTGSWANAQAWPETKWQREAKIGYKLSGQQENVEETYWSAYNPHSGIWLRPGRAPTDSIVIYARVDEGFSVWDPARNYWVAPQIPGGEASFWPELYNFTQTELWDGIVFAQVRGLAGQGGELAKSRGKLCNGLLNDWVFWQREPEQKANAAFNMLKAVLRRLSPDPDNEAEVLRPGEPDRVPGPDTTVIPTVVTPWGTVPAIYASAGIKRILGLTYILVWCWYEHLLACRMGLRDQSNSVVLLIDEIEAHLHPKWQRSIVGALLEVAKELGSTMRTQIIATTHAPLVLASIEPWFDEARDKVYEFEVVDNEVTLGEFKWAKFGDAASWLTSPIFDLGRARSKEAERALDAAYAYLAKKPLDKYPGLQSREAIDAELVRSLADDDPFWTGWEYHLEKEQQREEPNDPR